MSAEITAALNKVEQVLNHYRAFQEIEAALLVAADAERMAVELGLQSDALRKDITDLKATKVEVEQEIEAEKKTYGDYNVATIAKFDAVIRSKQAEIDATAAELVDLQARLAELRAGFIRDEEVAQKEIAWLNAVATSASERLEKIEAKIFELKGM